MAYDKHLRRMEVILDERIEENFELDFIKTESNEEEFGWR